MDQNIQNETTRRLDTQDAIVKNVTSFITAFKENIKEDAEMGWNDIQIQASSRTLLQFFVDSNFMRSMVNTKLYKGFHVFVLQNTIAFIATGWYAIQMYLIVRFAPSPRVR